jgi:hypothetical protein
MRSDYFESTNLDNDFNFCYQKFADSLRVSFKVYWLALRLRPRSSPPCQSAPARRQVSIEFIAGTDEHYVKALLTFFHYPGISGALSDRAIQRSRGQRPKENKLALLYNDNVFHKEGFFPFFV